MRHASADVPDLIQEVFLRLLRVPDRETIRNPQAYLYTIAGHVLHQYTLARALVAEPIDPADIAANWAPRSITILPLQSNSNSALN